MNMHNAHILSYKEEYTLWKEIKYKNISSKIAENEKWDFFLICCVELCEYIVSTMLVHNLFSLFIIVWWTFTH